MKLGHRPPSNVRVILSLAWSQAHEEMGVHEARLLTLLICGQVTLWLQTDHPNLLRWWPLFK